MQEVTLGSASTTPAAISDQNQGSGATGGWLSEEHLGLTGRSWVFILGAIGFGLLIFAGICCCLRSMRGPRRGRAQAARRQSNQEPADPIRMGNTHASSKKSTFGSMRAGGSALGQNGRSERQSTANGHANGKQGKAGRSNPFLAGFGAERADGNMAKRDANDDNPYEIEYF